MKQETQGILFSLSAATLWSFFPIITTLSYINSSPLHVYFYSLIFSTLFFIFFVSIRRKWHEIKNIKAFKDIFMGTFFIGIIFYFLIFYGIKYTTPANAAIFGLFEIFFSYLIFNLIKKEQISRLQITGGIIMIIGALFILFPGHFEIRLGDIIIIIACIFSNIGNHFQKRARKEVSSEVIMLIRTIISLIVTFIIISIFFPWKENLEKIYPSLPFFIMNGVFLLGLSKIFFIESIHRISVTLCLIIDSFSIVLTCILSYLILSESFTIWKIIGATIMILGSILVTIKTIHHSLNSKDQDS